MCVVSVWLGCSNTFVYMYYLRHRAQGENWPEWMGVIHGADCEWIFGKYLDQEHLSPEERLFNRHFMSHWANFARNSDPSLVGAPDPWPRWENHSQQVRTGLVNKFPGFPPIQNIQRLIIL